MSTNFQSIHFRKTWNYSRINFNKYLKIVSNSKYIYSHKQFIESITHSNIVVIDIDIFNMMLLVVLFAHLYTACLHFIADSLDSFISILWREWVKIFSRFPWKENNNLACVVTKECNGMSSVCKYPNNLWCGYWILI